ncbi:MAG: hypothetical protein HC893_01950 [Chloroflexaceae bacterium]|nr:hypothetical protein [Chloroflexaceae bacterium]
MTWPIDQSILYNVLLQVMQQAPTEPREHSNHSPHLHRLYADGCWWRMTTRRM